MQIEMRCPSCGAEHTPSKSDLLKGPEFYRRCPTCREPEPDRYRALFEDLGAPDRPGDAPEAA